MIVIRKEFKIGLQLISVKDIAPTDLCTVIQQVGEIGYEGVEFARGFFGKTVDVLGNTLDSCGMKAIGNHVFLNLLEEDLPRHIDECQRLGMNYLVPLNGLELWMDDDAVKRYIEKIRNLGRQCTAQGIKLALHSSTGYFQRDQKGVTLFERVLKGVEPEYLDAQVDTAWATCGGEDAATFLRKFKGRVGTVHLKDFHPPVPKKGDIYQRRDEALTRDSAVGDNGVIALEGIFEAAGEVGAQWLIVEHMERDSYEDSLAATEVSLRNVKALL